MCICGVTSADGKKTGNAVKVSLHVSVDVTYINEDV